MLNNILGAMETVQRVYTTGGSLCISINSVVAEDLGLKPGDLIRIDIVAVKSRGGEWEDVEED